jgi:hypothetical protein
MIEANQIQAGMEVADTGGQHVGTVDRVDGDRVALTGEGFSDALHHFVPLAAVTEVGGGRVMVEPATVSTLEALGHGETLSAGPDTPLFGTSGVGTGFGGSGRGEF